MFVSNSPGHSCCSPLPLDAINLVNTEPLTAEQRASGKRIYTDPHSRISIYTKCKAFRQRRDIFKIKIPVFLFYFLLGAIVEVVCASFQHGRQKSALRFGFVCFCVENHVVLMFCVCIH
jgi:hypothetical protein